jgi:hypothetical protein
MSNLQTFRPGLQTPDQLRFLSELLKEDITILVVLESESNKGYSTSKLIVLI